MTTKDKLALLREIEVRNADREKQILSSGVHKTVEHIAGHVLRWLDEIAGPSDTTLAYLVEMFTDALNALNQAKEQED